MRDIDILEPGQSIALSGKKSLPDKEKNKADQVKVKVMSLRIIDVENEKTGDNAVSADAG